MTRRFAPVKSTLTVVSIAVSTMGPAAGELVTATYFDSGVQAPVLVQCRNVRERLIRSDGRVDYVTRQDCTSAVTGSAGPATPRGSGCQIVRERVIRQNGQVDYLFVNRCY